MARKILSDEERARQKEDRLERKRAASRKFQAKKLANMTPEERELHLSVKREKGLDYYQRNRERVISRQRDRDARDKESPEKMKHKRAVQRIGEPFNGLARRDARGSCSK